MLTVWGRASSSNVQAVMWCIAELGLPFKRIDAGFTYGQTDTPEYLAMNPNGRVPTLCDDQHPPIWESGAILRYLANAYADDQFWPDDLPQRTQIDMWAEWSKVNVAIEFTGPIFWNAVRVPEARRDKLALQAAIEFFESKLQIAEEQLKKSEFLAGNSFTLADIQFGHVLHRYYDISIDRCDGLDHVSRYYQKLTQRAAYQEHVMVSYDELIDSM